MSANIKNIHLQSSPLSNQYLSAAYSTSEQIEQYVNEVVDTSDYAKSNEENTFTKNNTFTDVSANEISANAIDTGNILLGVNNEKYGNYVFASGENNKVGAKGFYYGAIELSNAIHPNTIYIYLKKDQPEFDERCQKNNDNRATVHEYSSPLISSDVSKTAIPTLIEKDIDVFNYMKDNYSNSTLSGIKLNVVNNSKRAFRRIQIEKFATINDEIRYDVLECKVDIMEHLFDNSNKTPETIFSNPYDYDDYSVVFCEHPEIGLNTNVSKNAMAVGTKNISMGRETISLGKQNYVEGNYATAIGRNNKVYGYVGFASGFSCQAGISADVGSMHAEGTETSALALASHTEGRKTKVHPGCNYSHAEGIETEVRSGEQSHAEGNKTIVNASNAHAEGMETQANYIGSHAEGYQTKTYGHCSHAEGAQTQTNGSSSHAEGYKTIANGDWSHASGCHAVTNHSRSFAWSGIDLGGNSLSSDYYQSKGIGTFNINPQGGIKGFYIGQNNFIDCILSAISQMDNTQKAQLKTILGIS